MGPGGETNGDGSGSNPGECKGEGVEKDDGPDPAEPAEGKEGKKVDKTQKSFARRVPPKTSPAKERFFAIFAALGCLSISGRWGSFGVLHVTNRFFFGVCVYSQCVLY